MYDGVDVGIAPSAQPEIAEAARGKARRVIVAGLERTLTDAGPVGDRRRWAGVIEIAA